MDVTIALIAYKGHAKISRIDAALLTLTLLKVMSGIKFGAQAQDDQAHFQALVQSPLVIDVFGDFYKGLVNSCVRHDYGIVSRPKIMWESRWTSLKTIQGRLLKFDAIWSAGLTKSVDHFIQGLSVTTLASGAVAPSPWTGYPFLFLEVPN